MTLKKLNKFDTKTFWWRHTFLLIVFLYFTIINIVQPSGDIKWSWHFAIWLPLTSYIVFWEGRKYYRIYKDLFTWNLNMSVLIGLGSHILFIYSTVYAFMNIDNPIYSYGAMWEGTAALILITNIGFHLEQKLKKSSLDLYKKLSDIKNSNVIVVRNGIENQVRASEVKLGETIIVKNGGFVPIDSLLLENGNFDYSNITGESNAISLSKGDQCISGSYNLGSSIKMSINRLAKDSTISHIVSKIESLSETKPKMQAIADKILKHFIPFVLLSSLLTFIVWLVIGYTANIRPWEWIHISEPFNAALLAGVSVLAISCPCALGIATPLVYTVSSMLAAKSSIVINEPKALEEINRVSTIAFDKTGTLTTGKLKISKIHGDQKYIFLAKSLEKNVHHPIASAINELEGTTIELDKINNIEKGGVWAKWENKIVELKRYVENEFEVSKTNTLIGLYIDKKIKMVFELENILRKNVIETINKLKKQNLKVIMITGDSDEVAYEVAQKIGITEYFSNTSPNEKFEIIKSLQKEGKVAFVGDGFNDSLAIKQSDVSIAFSSGSDITNSLSDYSITSENFESIGKIFTLGKMNKKNVILSLTYAFAFNIIFIPLAMLLIIWPWVSASIMALSDILVSLNAFIYKKNGERKLKLKKKKNRIEINQEEKIELN